MAATTRFNVHVAMDARGYQQGAQGIVAGNTTAAASTTNLDRNLRKLYLTLGGIGLLAVGREAVRMAADFESSFTKINNLVGGISRQTLAAWREDVKSIAKETAQSAGDTARALYVVTGAGLKTGEAIDVLRMASKASAIGLGDTSTVARAVTSAMQAYGKENLSAAAATDVLVATVRAGNMATEDLAPVIGRVVPLTALLGVSFDQLGSFVATFTRLGVGADEAVTALRGTMIALLGPTKGQEEALSQVGMTMAGLRQEIKDKGLTQALIDLVQAFRGNDDALSAIIPNSRALVGVLSMTGAQAGEAVVTQRELANSLGVTNAAMEETRKSDPSFAFRELVASAKTALTTIGSGMLPALVALSATLTAVADAVRPVGKDFGVLLTTILPPLAGLIKLIADNWDLVRFALAAMLALRIGSWAMGLIETLGSMHLKLLATEAATWANIKAWVAMTAMDVKAWLVGAAGGVGLLVTAIAALGLGLSYLIDRWKEASTASIANDVAVTNAAGSIVALTQAAKTGAAVTKEMFEQGAAGAEALKTEIAAVEAKLRTLADAKAEAGPLAVGGNGTPVSAVNAEIDAQNAKLEGLKRNLATLQGLLGEVKVAADEAGKATGGTPPPPPVVSIEYRKLERQIRAEIDAQQDLVRAWQQGRSAGEAMARTIEVEAKATETAKELHGAEAASIKALVRELASYQDQVEAIAKVTDLKEQVAGVQALSKAWADGSAASARAQRELERERTIREAVGKATGQQAKELRAWATFLTGLQQGGALTAVTSSLEEERSNLEAVATAYGYSAAAGREREAQLADTAEALRLSAGAEEGATAAVLAGVEARRKAQTSVDAAKSIDDLRQQAAAVATLLALDPKRFRTQQEYQQALAKANRELEQQVLLQKMQAGATPAQIAEWKALISEINAGTDALAANAQTDTSAQGVAEKWQSIASLIAGAFDQMGGSVGKTGKALTGFAEQMMAVNKLGQSFKLGADGHYSGDFAGMAQQGYSTGQSVYNTGIFGDAGRGQGQTFGGGLSGNYADVGAGIGGAIGAVIGSLYGGAAGGTVGTMIGSVIGGVIGSAIKAGADEGLASLRSVGGQISTKITKDEGGLGGVVGGIANKIRDGVYRIMDALGGTLNGLGGLDLKIRDDQLIVFVNGLRRVFRDAAEGINFAIGELLRTADVSGISQNQQAVLTQARNNGGQGQMGADEIASNLDFATQMDRLPLSDTGQALAQLADWFRMTSQRAIDLGLTQQTLADIIGKLNEGYQAARRTIEEQLNVMAGRTTEAGSAVASYSAHVQDAIRSAREYNTAVAKEAADRAKRIVDLTREVAAQQAAAASFRSQMAAIRDQMGHGPRNGEPSEEDQQLAQQLQALGEQARQAEESVRSMTEQLGLLGAQTDQGSIDVGSYITDIIKNSRNLFKDFTDQFTAGPVEAYQRQMEQFGEFRDAAGKLYDDNMALAQTDEDRAAAAEVLAGQLGDLAAAQQAYREQLNSQTYIGVLEQLSRYTGDTKLAAELQRAKGVLELAQLATQIGLLRTMGMLTAEQMAMVDGAFATVQAYFAANGKLPGADGGGGGGGKGGGRRQAREDFLDELAQAQSPVLTGWAAKLDEINKKIAAWVEEAKKLGISLDEVNKAGDALKAKLRGDIMAYLEGIVGGGGSVGGAIAKITQERDDLLKVAKDLHIPLGLIERAFRQQLRAITAGVMNEVRSYKNVFGQMDLGIALQGNHDQAEKLRAELLALQKAGVDVTGALADVDLAEQRHAQLLKDQANASFLGGLSEWVTDAKLALELRKAEASLQMQSLKAQLTTLLASGDLSDAQRAQYRQWLADAQKAIDVYVATGNRPGDAPPPPTDNPDLGLIYMDLYNQVHAFNDETGGLSARFQQLRDSSAELSKKIRDSGLAAGTQAELQAALAEETRRANEQLGQESTADLFTRIAGYLEDGALKTELLTKAAEIKFTLEMVQIQAQIEFLKLQGVLVGENLALAQEGVQWMLDHRDDIINGMVGGSQSGGGTGSTWDDQQSANEAAAALYQKALDLLNKYRSAASALDPFTAAIAQLNDDFAVLHQAFGDSAELQELYASALQQILDQYLQPIRDLQHDLATGDTSPFDPQQQFDMVMQQFLAAQEAFANGDLSVIQDIPGMAQQLLQLAGTLFPTGSQAYLGIYDQIQEFLNEILAMDPNNLPGPYSQPSQTVILGGGPVAVQGIDTLNSSIMNSGSAQVSQLQLLAINTERAYLALESIDNRLSTSGSGLN